MLRRALSVQGCIASRVKSCEGLIAPYFFSTYDFFFSLSNITNRTLTQLCYHNHKVCRQRLRTGMMKWHLGFFVFSIFFLLCVFFFLFCVNTQSDKQLQNIIQHRGKDRHESKTSPTAPKEVCEEFRRAFNC